MIAMSHRESSPDTFNRGFTSTSSFRSMRPLDLDLSRILDDMNNIQLEMSSLQSDQDNQETRPISQSRPPPPSYENVVLTVPNQK